MFQATFTRTVLVFLCILLGVQSQALAKHYLSHAKHASHTQNASHASHTSHALHHAGDVAVQAVVKHGSLKKPSCDPASKGACWVNAPFALITHEVNTPQTISVTEKNSVYLPAFSSVRYAPPQPPPKQYV